MSQIETWALRAVGNLLKIERNSKPADVVSKCSSLIANAKQRVHIVAGELEGRFYTDPEMLSSLGWAAAQGANVVIIHGPNCDEESVSKIREIPRVKLVSVSQRPASHYMVVDQSVRVEDYHVPYQEDRRAYIAKDTIYLANKLDREFTKLIAGAKAQEQEGVWSAADVLR